jgi:flagellar biosynthesis/type III secretory pathway M-ring protein FliF/YscJ
MDTIQLTKQQQTRLQHIASEINANRAKIAPLQDIEKSLQMTVQMVLQTILEAHEVDANDTYQMNADATALVRVEAKE